MIQNLSAPLLFHWIRCCADLVQWCVWYLACPWRAGKRSRSTSISFRFVKPLVKLAVFMYSESRATDDLLNIILLILCWELFSLASTNLSPLSRNKWATCCCHLLSNLHIMKGSPGRNAWGKMLILHMILKIKLQRWVFLVSLTTSEQTYETGQGWTREIISVLFYQRLFSFLFKHHTSWHFENPVIIWGSSFSGKKLSKFPTRRWPIKIIRRCWDQA